MLLADATYETVSAAWQLVEVAPKVNVGVATEVVTVNDFDAVDVPQAAVAVSVNVTDVADVADAVYVAVLGVEPPLFANEPPAPPSSQTAEVAPPPNDPSKAAVVAPWHTADVAPPALTVIAAVMVNVLVEVASVHPLLAVAVKVSVLLPAVISFALGV